IAVIEVGLFTALNLPHLCADDIVLNGLAVTAGTHGDGELAHTPPLLNRCVVVDTHSLGHNALTVEVEGIFLGIAHGAGIMPLASFILILEFTVSDDIAGLAA